MHTWHSLVYHGDEWFAAYACIPSNAVSPIWFSVGHAVELYLKAAHTKLFGDINAAIKHGHRIKDLWDACRQENPNFMKGYAFRDHVFSVDFLDGSVFKHLSSEDQLHFIENQSLYVVFKHLQDLKYLGLPWKSRSGPMALGFVHPDPYWTQFVRTLRTHLEYPPRDHADRILQMLELGCLPPDAAHYLQALY
jgi:hypothetical protein